MFYIQKQQQAREAENMHLQGRVSYITFPFTYSVFRCFRENKTILKKLECGESVSLQHQIMLACYLKMSLGFSVKKNSLQDTISCLEPRRSEATNPISRLCLISF